MEVKAPGRGRLILPLLLSTLALTPACAQNSARMAKDLSRLESELQDLRGFQAEQTSQIGSLQNELRALQGRVEELEYGSKPKTAYQPQEPGFPAQAQAFDFSSLRERGNPPPIVPAPVLEQDETRAQALTGESAKFIYNAFSSMRAGAFGEAAALLQEALAQTYNTDFYPYVLFWIGVANDGRGDSKAALKAYHELVSDYPKHTRVPLALLRQGSVFIRLRDSATARLTFEKLIAEFPKSAEAQSAKLRLKDLRG